VPYSTWESADTDESHEMVAELVVMPLTLTLLMSGCFTWTKEADTFAASIVRFPETAIKINKTRFKFIQPPVCSARACLFAGRMRRNPWSCFQSRERAGSTRPLKSAP
jgi:hypothetical protein